MAPHKEAIALLKNEKMPAVLSAEQVEAALASLGRLVEGFPRPFRVLLTRFGTLLIYKMCKPA